MNSELRKTGVGAAASYHNFLVQAAKTGLFRPGIGAAVIGKQLNFRIRQIERKGFEPAPDHVHDAP